MILRSNSCNHTNWCWSRDISISRSWNNHCSYSGFNGVGIYTKSLVVDMLQSLNKEYIIL